MLERACDWHVLSLPSSLQALGSTTLHFSLQSVVIPSLLQMGLRAAEATLAAAASLLSKLTGEKASWTAQSQEHNTALQTLPACAAVAAAFMTYAASEAEAVRLELLREWRGLEGLQLPADFSFQGFLSTESELLQWKAEGLQGDQVRRRPLIKRSANECFVVMSFRCKRPGAPPPSCGLVTCEQCAFFVRDVWRSVRCLLLFVLCGHAGRGVPVMSAHPEYGFSSADCTTTSPPQTLPQTPSAHGAEQALGSRPRWEAVRPISTPVDKHPAVRCR